MNPFHDVRRDPAGTRGRIDAGEGRGVSPRGRDYRTAVLAGDIGAGLGASHQTGWTGLIARLLDTFGRVTAEDALETPKERLEARLVREQVAGE